MGIGSHRGGRQGWLVGCWLGVAHRGSQWRSGVVFRGGDQEWRSGVVVRGGGQEWTSKVAHRGCGQVLRGEG